MRTIHISWLPVVVPEPICPYPATAVLSAVITIGIVRLRLMAAVVVMGAPRLAGAIDVPPMHKVPDTYVAVVAAADSVKVTR